MNKRNSFNTTYYTYKLYKDETTGCTAAINCILIDTRWEGNNDTTYY